MIPPHILSLSTGGQTWEAKKVVIKDFWGRKKYIPSLLVRKFIAHKSGECFIVDLYYNTYYNKDFSKPFKKIQGGFDVEHIEHYNLLKGDAVLAKLEGGQIFVKTYKGKKFKELPFLNYIQPTERIFSEILDRAVEDERVFWLADSLYYCRVGWKKWNTVKDSVISMLVKSDSLFVNTTNGRKLFIFDDNNLNYIKDITEEQYTAFLLRSQGYKHKIYLNKRRPAPYKIQHDKRFNSSWGWNSRNQELLFQPDKDSLWIRVADLPFEIEDIIPQKDSSAIILSEYGNYIFSLPEKTLKEYIYKDFFKEFFTHKITQFAIRQGTFIGCFTGADRIMEYLPNGDSMVCKQMTYDDSITEFYHSFALDDLLSLFRDIEKNYSVDKPTFTDFDIAKEDIESRRLDTVSPQKTAQFLNYNLSVLTLTRGYSYERVFSAIIHNPNGDKLQIIFHLANLQAFGLPLVFIKNDKDQIISYNCALGKLLKEAFLDADNIKRPRFKSLTDSFDYWQEDLYRKSTANQNR